MPERFGTLPDGTLIEEVRLAAAGMQASVLSWGAVLRDLLMPDRAGAPRRVVLGLSTLDDYVAHSRNFGAICGRVANRIGNASFALDGQEYRLTPNYRGRHMLHGGDGQFGRRPWTITAAEAASVVLEVTSPAGEDGFPGTVTARCTYALEPPASLRVTLSATADAPTPVNLAHHSYWNLDGARDVSTHRLRVAADFFTPTSTDGIPTGEVRSVAATPYDFRAGRSLGGPGAARPGYDINLVLARGGSVGLFDAAMLENASGDLALSIATTAPGLQVFDGHTLDVPVAGLHGFAYGARAGVALEPQLFPDSVNQPHFPSCILRPGETFRQETIFRIV
jgi:aldose 1-epimerase